ncbi:MAG: glycosyltransferase family 9 protein [Bdellovibrionaceae bacterium]|nr:glycosyltransferase family 9 protein [Pseudobdellovibrionaceae bacterium]
MSQLEIAYLNPTSDDLKIKKIILVHTAFLGDLVLSIPLLLNLKKKYSQAEITLICRKNVGDFFQKLNLVDKYYEIEKGNSKSYRHVINSIASESYDYLLCPHQSIRTLFFISKIKAKTKIGYYKWYNFLFFDHRLVRNSELPEALRLIQLLEPLVSSESKKVFENRVKNQNFNQKKEYHLKEVPLWASLNLAEIVQKDEFSYRKLQKKLALINETEDVVVEKKQKLICVFPGSVWATKRWREENYIQLISLLLKNQFRIFLMGAPGEEKLCQEIFRQVNAVSKSSDLYDFSARTTVYESVLLMKEADLIIGNDSASSHLACVLDKKLITFFGPTVLGFGYRPWGNNVYVFENETLSCRPCGKHGHQVCPLGTHECMRSILSFEVMKFILKIV